MSASPVFPDSPQDKKVLGIMYGGIGDVLMIANTCSCLTDFTFAIQPHQMGIVSRIKGCKTVPLDYARNTANFQDYDAVINFMYFISSGANLKTGGYYEILEKKIRHKSPLAGMDIPYQPKEGIYVHMQASNPNRDWLRPYWEQTLTELARKEPVYLLGQKADFRVEGPNIINLADENTDIVFQAEKLSTAKYFLGVDSGFCHIAGIIGVPGSILFTNTLPSDVISRYSTLSGIDAFQGGQPSRSTRIPCETSERFKKALTPDIVIRRVLENV